jgi:hypothetical protein
MRRYHPHYKAMNTRTLKIETVGDYWRGRVSPKIRLSGRWLDQAGFKPGNRVEVRINQPGILMLRFLALSKPLDDEIIHAVPVHNARILRVFARRATFRDAPRETTANTDSRS